MELNKIRTSSELCDKLINKRMIIQDFVNDVTVNVTEMFRDPEFYISLQKNVIQSLNNLPYIRIWHPGCSSGEEVYSMAILLYENGMLENSMLYGTDINTEVLSKARKGIYPLRNMKEYTSNYIKTDAKYSFAEYYTASYDAAILRAFLKRRTVFSKHDLVTGVVPDEFNLIVCRNVLIYFNRDLQERVFKLFCDSLYLGGFLALGPRETLLLSDVNRRFELVDKKENIYKKIK